MSDAFYVVWNPRTPVETVHHSREYLAVLEAERLARANPGQEFIVLRAMSRSIFHTPSITEKYDDEIPF